MLGLVLYEYISVTPFHNGALPYINIATLLLIIPYGIPSLILFMGMSHFKLVKRASLQKVNPGFVLVISSFYIFQNSGNIDNFSLIFMSGYFFISFLSVPYCANSLGLWKARKAQISKHKTH
jgi:hypothetical protein